MWTQGKEDALDRLYELRQELQTHLEYIQDALEHAERIDLGEHYIKTLTDYLAEVDTLDEEHAKTEEQIRRSIVK
jgi:hypothetical protein